MGSFYILHQQQSVAMVAALSASPSTVCQAHCLALPPSELPSDTGVYCLYCLYVQTLTNCGDAVRIESPGPGVHCLDNTVWFDQIINSRVGKHYINSASTLEQ